MEPRPIPPFYAVYLLRSIHRHTSLYVGSTPNPRRRLAQHNSEKSKTSQTQRGRPWEMICLVHGFPSSIAALQFEWTWQNPHLTRRITPDERITTPGVASGYSRSGKPRKRPTRPRIGLKDRLANLHLLLHVPSFARWPLQVRFFDAEVYKVWTSRVIKSDNDDVNAILDIAVPSDQPEPAGAQALQELPVRKRQKMMDNDAMPSAAANVVSQGGVDGLDVSYKRLRPALQKARFVLAEGETVKCAVCAEDMTGELLRCSPLCSNDHCNAASHLFCLADYFIAAEPKTSTSDVSPVVPKEGPCPSCGERLQWADLAAALSLRLRDSMMIDEILEPRKGRRKKDQGQKSDWKTQMVVLDSEEGEESVEPDGRIFSDVGAYEDDFEHEEPGVSDDDEGVALRPEDVFEEQSLEADAPDDTLGESSARSRPTFRMPRSLDGVRNTD